MVEHDDLSFDESIVIELNFGRKRFFFTVLEVLPLVTTNQLINLVDETSRIL